MSEPVAMRAKRKRSGSVHRSSRCEEAALGRAVRAAVEPLEKRVMLSSGTPAWLDSSSAATWDPNTHALTVTGPATIVADPGADEPLVTVSGFGAALTIEPTSGTWIHLGALTLTGGGSAEVTRPDAAAFDETASMVLELGIPGGGSTPALSIDAASNSTLGIEDNDLIVRDGFANESGYAWNVGVQSAGMARGSGALALDPSAFQQDGLAMPSDPAVAANEPAEWDVAGRTVTLGVGDVLVKYIPAGTPIGAWTVAAGDDTPTSPGGTATPIAMREQVGPRYVALASFDQPDLASGPTPAYVSSVVVNGNSSSLLGPQRSMVDNVLYTFSEPVTLNASTAFGIAVAQGHTGTIPTLNWSAISPDASGASTQWVVTFSGTGVNAGSIANGVYNLTLNAAAVTSEANPTVAAQPHNPDTFFRLFGDADGDGAFGTADQNAFTAALNHYNPIFDYNGDGTVNLADEFQASKNYNVTYTGLISFNPAALRPTNVTATVNGSTAITVSWTGPSDPNVSGYTIQRWSASDPSGTWTTVAEHWPNTPYHDLQAQPGTDYEYRVAAEESGPTSDWSLPSNDALTPAPTASAILTATAGGANDIRLNWDTNFGTNAPILIQRSTDGSIFKTLDTVGAGTSTYDDTSVVAGKTYYYRVESPPSGSSVQTSVVASATAGPAGDDWVLVDTVPIPLDGSAVSSNVALVAGANYQLRARGDFYIGGGYGRADAEFQYSPTTGGYDDHSPRTGNYFDQHYLEAGIGVNDPSRLTVKSPYWGSYNPAHQYQVDVVGGGSALSFDYHDDYYGDNVADDAANPLQVQIWAHLPAAPSNLVAIANGTGTVALTWQNNATDQTGFVLQRSDGDDATFHTINDHLDANATSYTDSVPDAGQTYYYRIAAFDAAGDGPFSNEAQTGTTTYATVSGHVYQSYVNSQPPAPPTPLAGVRVYVDKNTDGSWQSTEPAAMSAADGSYTISVPLSDSQTYSLRVDLTGVGPSVITSPADGNYQLSLTPGGAVTDQNFDVYLAQAPTFDSTPPQTAHVNPYAATPPAGPGVAWQPGDLFLSTNGVPLKVPTAVMRLHGDGTPVTNGAPDGSAQAEYLTGDTGTQGNWGGKYGADGYMLFGTSDASLPVYAQLSAVNATATSYPDQDGNALAMQTAPGSATRVASAYTSSQSFTLDLNLTDGKAHQVSLYLADYETPDMKESVTVADAGSGAVLGTYSVPDDYGWGYLTWNLSGHVTITVTATGSAGGCAASALLFDPVQTRYLTYNRIAMPTGLAFDPKGDLFVTNDGNGYFTKNAVVAQFGADGNFDRYLLPDQTPIFSGDESIVFDAAGDMYVSNVGLVGITNDKVGGFGIYKFNPKGQLVEILFSPQRVDWMDLAADQHTLVFTTEGDVVYQADTNTGQVSTTPFATIPPPPPGAQAIADYAYAVRFLPNGGTTVVGDDGQDHTAVMLLADSADVLALGPDASGKMVVVKTYNATDPQDPKHTAVNNWFAMTLDPNGTAFWSAGGGADPDSGTGVSSTVAEFDIRTGSVLQSFDTDYPVTGMTVYGEQTAALQQPTEPVVYAAHAFDPNNNPVVYSLLDPTNGATIEPGSGLLTWTPPGPGTYSFTVVAADADFPQLQTQQTFAVKVDYAVAAEDGPKFSTPTTLSPATVGQQYTNQIVATDDDGDRLQYALVGAPPGFTINRDNGGIGWLPNADDLARGYGTVTVKVTDSRDASIQQTFTIPIQQPVPGNQPPKWDNSQVLADATVGKQWRPMLSATDPDKDPVSFVPISLPDGMTVVPSGSGAGQISWTPTPAQAGVQQFVIGATDGRGTIVEKTFTITVDSASLTFSGIAVQQLAPDTVRLTAVTTDPAMLKTPGLKFQWGLSSPLPAGDDARTGPVIKYGSDRLADSVEVVFDLAGVYQFTAKATDDSGEIVASPPETVTVAQIPTRVVVTPPAFGISPGQTQQLTASVYDQFGDPMTSQPPILWSLVSSGSGGGSISPGGLYTAGPNTGTDVAQASVATGSQAVTGDAAALVAGSNNALVGVATGGMVVTEGQDVTYSGVAPHYGYLAVFYDPRSNPQAGDYTATVNWADGTISPAGQVTIAADTDPSLPSAVVGHLFTVSAEHTYAQIGQYALAVNVALKANGPNGPWTTITPLTGQGITVQAAGIEPIVADISPMASALYNGVVGEFMDDSPVGNIDQFVAMIDWGDGTDPTQGTLSESNGTYIVSGSHTYGSTGTLDNPHIDVYEVDNEPAGQIKALRGTILMAVTVQKASLLPPQGLTVTAIKEQVTQNNQQVWIDGLEIQWGAQPNSTVAGYLLVRTNPDGSQTPLPDPHDAQTLVNNTKFADFGQDGGDVTNANGLPAGADYGYQVIAVDAANNQSAKSAVVNGKTYSTTLPPAQPTVAIDGATGGVKLTWPTTTDSTVSGWDVLRARVLSDGSSTTPFVSILGGQEVPVTAADHGQVSYLDDAVVAGQTYEYELVAVGYVGERSKTSDASAQIQVEQAANTPAAPTNLATGYAGDYFGTYRVGLHWDAPPGFAGLGYDVYRVTDAQLTAAHGQFVTDLTTLIGSSNDTGYTDDLTAAGKYWYEVKAVAATADGQEVSSTPSTMNDVDMSLGTGALQAPSNLIAPAAGITANQIHLFWTDNTVDEAGFEIRRKQAGSPDTDYQVVGRSTQDDAQFLDATVLRASAYDYEVLAYNFDANSSPVYSLPVTLSDVQTPTTGSKPNPPGNLLQDAGNTTWNQIGLTWTASTSSDVDTYYVYREQPDPTGGNKPTWLLLTPQPVKGTSYVDMNVQPGSYSYEVTAVSSSGGGQSDPTVPASMSTTPTTTQAPYAMIASPAAFSGIKLNFGMDTSSDDRIKTLTPVRLIVADPNATSGGGSDPTLAWTLVLHPEGQTDGQGGQPADIPLASGNGPVGSVADPSGQTVYTLDPTQFANGNYQLILSATDASGKTIQNTEVSLYSQTKLGNLTLPVTDLQYTTPTGQQVSVQRVYNSQNANVLGDFGYGWSLQTANTTVTTTAQSSPDGGGVAFAPGDVVYITLPDGSQHAFQFFPVPADYSNEYPDPYNQLYAESTYWVQFVCVDGSNATLTVLGDIHSEGDRITLRYDGEAKVFRDQTTNATYNPATAKLDGTDASTYTLTTADGTIYTIAAGSGTLTKTQDPNGNVVNYGNDSITTSGGDSLKITRNSDGTISKIELRDASDTTRVTLNYRYDPSNPGTLTHEDRNGAMTNDYQYDAAPGMSHYLTQVTVGGVTTLQAQYDSLGRLTSLTDAYGNQSNTAVTSSDGSGGGQFVADLSKSQASGQSAQSTPGTQNIYDSYGDVARSIQPVTDANNNVLGYTVTVHGYAYASAEIADEVSDIFDSSPGDSKQAGNTVQNALISQIDYAPFFVPVTTTQADAYQTALTKTPQDAQASPLSETDYYYVNNDGGSPANIGLPSQQKQFVGDGSFRTTSYDKYVNGKPSTVKVTVTDVHGNTQQVSKTDNYYDASGNLIYTFDALGQGTEYDYSTGTDGLPKGLLLSTWKVSGEQTLTDTDPKTLPTQLARLTLNTYYSEADLGLVGSAYGRLRTSTDASGRLTYYAYDAMGNVIDQYSIATGVDALGNPVKLWVGTTTTYDSYDRPQYTYQGEYLAVLSTSNADGTNDVLTLNANSTPGEGLIDINPRDQDANSQPFYPGFNGGGPLQASGTTYDDQGRVYQTQDQYSGTTTTTYDANGNVIKTENPDGTKVLSVYDPMGRVMWQTDPFSGSEDPTTVMATHTVYDSQGRVIETDRYQGTIVTIPDDITTATSSVAPGSEGTLISSTHTDYDPQGRVVESDDASGLRTGTIYYADGQVQSTGPLNASAPVGGGSSGVFQLSDFTSYTQYLYDQVDTSTGQPYSGLVYDQVVDPNGHWTDTYQDQLGRTIFTVYQDGSFTQTLYSVNGQQVTASSPMAPQDPSDPLDPLDPLNLNPPAGLTILPGGSETVSIAQRKAGDAVVATFSVYDAAGNLLDVYQPPVVDADPNSPTHGQTIAPRWQYTYDQGNETSQTDPRGNVTKWSYDERGNKLTHTLPGLQQESWTYDQYNRVVTHVDFNGDTAWEVYVNPSDWHDGRLVAEYRYTPGTFTSQMLSQTPGSTPWSERTEYIYDDGLKDTAISYTMPTGEGLSLGRLIEVQEWTSSDTSKPQDFNHTTYDAITGQPTSIASNEGVVNYAYDPVTGRKVRMWATTPGASPVTSDDTAYAYDSQGRLSDVFTLMLDGTTYATFNGIDPTSHNPTFTGGTPLDVHYTYDLAGNLKTESQPDQTTTTYTYDSENRLTDLSTVNTSTNEPAFAEHYDLYNNGLRQDVTDTRYNADGATFSQTTTNWLYDNDGRLTSEILTVPQPYVAAAPAAYANTFKFDLDGNRVEEDLSGSQNATITYTYNGDNQLLTETRTGDGAYSILYGHYDSNNVFHAGYDAAGNLVEQHRTGTNPEDDSYAWDLRGRMTQVTSTVTPQGGGTPATTVTKYTYDTDGVRTSETTGTTSTYYLNDPNNPTGYTKAVEELTSTDGKTSDATLHRAFLFGLQVEGQATTSDPNGPLFLIHDGHGNTRALLNVSGGMVEQYNYDAYGNLLASNGVPASAANALTPWLQGDGLYDPATSWNYNLARWRDGFRFTSMDPTVFAPGELADANWYAYTADEPTNLTDPSGQMSDGEAAVVAGIIAVLATMTLHSLYSGLHWSIRAAQAHTWQQRLLFNEYAAVDAFDFTSGIMGGPISGGPTPQFVFTGPGSGSASIPWPSTLLPAPPAAFSGGRSGGSGTTGSGASGSNSQDAPGASAGNYPPQPGGNGLFPKSWRDAVDLLKKATGKGVNVRVRTLLEAQDLLQQALPDVYNAPRKLYENAVYGWEIHPAEPQVGNDLPHIKWYDYRPGQPGAEGHIFFEKS
jgi:YD repeat-containing protein